MPPVSHNDEGLGDVLAHVVLQSQEKLKGPALIDVERAVSTISEAHDVGSLPDLNPHPTADVGSIYRAGSLAMRLQERSFAEFLALLNAETSFFDGANRGSPEYDARLEKARSAFEARLARKHDDYLNTATDAGTKQTNATTAPDQHSIDEAERLKEKGNESVKAKDYPRAHDLYTEAIRLNPTSAVYFSNRAAALIHLERFSEAVTDCETAIRLDPAFIRARERLASAYRHLKMYDSEVDALSDAIRVAPTDSRLQRELESAKARQAAPGSTPGNSTAPGSANMAQAGPRGFPPGNSSGGMGGPGGAASGLDMASMMRNLESLSSDPSMAQMMQAASQNGALQGAIQSVMQNPELMQSMMSSMGQMFGAPGTAPGPGSDQSGKGSRQDT